jgi:hypothetical protein
VLTGSLTVHFGAAVRAELESIRLRAHCGHEKGGGEKFTSALKEKL